MGNNLNKMNCCKTNREEDSNEIVAVEDPKKKSVVSMQAYIRRRQACVKKSVLIAENRKETVKPVKKSTFSTLVNPGVINLLEKLKSKCLFGNKPLLNKIHNLIFFS